MDYEGIDLDSFERILLLKNQLIVLSSDQLKELYQEDDCYVVFVDTVAQLLNHESAFIYLSKDFITRILEVLDIHRFNLDKKVMERFEFNEDIMNNVINQIVMRLNEINSDTIQNRKSILIAYIEYNENVRVSKFAKIEDFSSSLANDSVVYFNLKGSIDMPVKDELILASIHYFLEEIPEFFDNKLVADRAMHELDRISNSGGFSKRYRKKSSKYAKELLKKITKEE